MGVRTLRYPNHLDLRHAASIGPFMREVELLVETYLTAERDLATAVDAAGGSVLLSDGRVTTGRAEFDAVSGRPRRRAWVIVRKNAPMPAWR